MRRGKQAFLLLAGSVAAAVWMAAAPVDRGVRVETAVVQPGELVQTLWMSGTVQYVDQQPYVSLKAGKIAGVYVRPGDSVSEGDLLFQMDTAAEEQALSDLYETRYQNRQAMSGMNEAAAALNYQAELEWQQMEMQWKRLIESGQIRAQGAGMVDEVYVKEGEWVNEETLLGCCRGQEKQIVASVRKADAALITENAEAWLKTDSRKIPAVVRQSLPSPGNDDIYMIAISAENPAALDSFTISETVQVEVITDVKQADALMPLNAAAEDGAVWIVSDRRVQKKNFEWTLCSRTHAQAEKEWAGQTVLLYPDRYELKEGMPVQVSE